VPVGCEQRGGERTSVVRGAHTASCAFSGNGVQKETTGEWWFIANGREKKHQDPEN